MMAIFQSFLSALLLLHLAVTGNTLPLSTADHGEEPTINATSCDEALSPIYENNEPMYLELPDRLTCDATKVRESCRSHTW